MFCLTTKCCICLERHIPCASPDFDCNTCNEGYVCFICMKQWTDLRCPVCRTPHTKKQVFMNYGDRYRLRCTLVVLVFIAYMMYASFLLAFMFAWENVKIIRINILYID